MTAQSGTRRMVLQLVVGGAVAAALLLAAAGVLLTRDSDASDGLNERFTAVARAAERDQVQVALATATDFDWSKFHAFHGYTDTDEVERKLGFVWDGAGRALTGTDGHSLVVFTDQRRVVRSGIVDRCTADFVNAGSVTVRRRDAVFKVEPWGDRCYRFSLVPRPTGT